MQIIYKKYLMKKYYFILLFIACISYAKNNKVTGFYLGVGSGINVTRNSNFYKIYNDGSNQYQRLDIGGPVLGYSLPFYLYSGYRFFEYFSVELSYNYSGNQTYSKPSGQVSGSDFWGSQNTISLDAVGYFPLIHDDLFLKGRIGIAGSLDGATTYPGNPKTYNLTSTLGLGVQFFVMKHMSINFDYINYGVIFPIYLVFKPSVGAPDLGIIDNININQYLLSLQYHF